MGVRGLTSFIARRAELYLKPYELHDCNLVIDGDNLACNLYNSETGIYSAFGGDYDNFYRTVVNFFAVLDECNIRAYVLMDGGYEHRKLRTVGKRMRAKIAVLKHINPNESRTIFPLMMKEVFVDAVRDCGVPVMRCTFEADDELAVLARKLKCPVLSYDSDFYIHNVMYIPLITLTVKAHTKVCKSNSLEKTGETNRELRQNEVKKVQKNTKRNRIVNEIVVDNKEKTKNGKTYKYLDCCLYRIENLIARGSLSKEKLPLFAAMIGNDYISRSAFRNFFVAGMGKIGRSRKLNQQQRRIKVILQWLKTETADSALQKIVTRLKKDQRESLIAQVEGATSGYSNEKCVSYDYLKNYENIYEDFLESDEEQILENNEEEYIESSEEWEEFENYEEEEINEFLTSEEEQVSENDEEIENHKVPNLKGVEEENKELENISAQRVFENDDNPEEVSTYEVSALPSWFLNKLYPANLPRYFVDLMYLRKYINNPQIEHFPYNDCNLIAIPILKLIFSLLNNPREKKDLSSDSQQDTTQTCAFTYVTRVTAVTNIIYKHIEVEEKPKYDFVPEAPNPHFLRVVFENKMPELNSDELFSELNKLPEDIRLYFLAIVYWLQKSQHYDVIHIHSLLVCLTVLKIIDSKIVPVRDQKSFQKRFGKILKRERQVRDKEEANGIKREVKDEVRALPVPDRLPYISKSDCYLVQNELLKYFHMQEIFKKKYHLYSSTILHAFAEFQSVVFQLQSLNALLDFPYPSPHMGQLYCGVFLYNLYDTLKTRLDIEYHIKNYIFRDSQMMFDFYSYLWQWCVQFIPSWNKIRDEKVNPPVSKRTLKKKRQQARRNATNENIVKDPNVDMLSAGSGMDDGVFFDLSNKFCNILNVK